MRNNFLEKSYAKCGGHYSKKINVEHSRHYSKKSMLNISMDL